MTYDLAKELKAAGFPQKGDGIWYPDGPESAYMPTLEELIEACGRQFRNLAQHDGQFTASMLDSYNDQIGATPTEAVARSWLAFNVK